jgi:hypothetical protein
VRVRDHHPRIDGLARVRSACPERGILGKWREDRGRPLEAEALGKSYGRIDERAVEQVTDLAERHPAEPVQPRALMEGPGRSVDIGPVLHQDVVVLAARAGESLAGNAIEQPGGGRRPSDPCCPLQSWRHREQRGKDAASHRNRVGDRRGRTLHVEVQQHPGRLAQREFNMVAAAADDAVTLCRVELRQYARGDDLHGLTTNHVLD